MSDTTKVQVHTFHEPDSHTAQYVVVDPSTNACMVIDSVVRYNPVTSVIDTAPADEIIAFIQDKGLDCQWVLETHAHADHVSGAPHVQAAVGGTSGIGSKITVVQSVFKAVFCLGDLVPDGSHWDKLFDDGEEFALGSLSVKVMHTPGHTPACVSYVVHDSDGNPESVYVGDTIFQPDMGSARCDFPGGDSATLWSSIQKLFTLPDEVRMFTCHDYAPGDRETYEFESTIGAQKESNKHVAVGTDENQFITWRAERDATLNLPRLLIPSIQLNVRAGNLHPADINGASYLKFPINMFADLKGFLDTAGKFRALNNDYMVGPYLSTDDVNHLATGTPIKSIMCCAPADEAGHAKPDVEAAAAANNMPIATCEFNWDTATPEVLAAGVDALAALPKPVCLYCKTGGRGELLAAALKIKQDGLSVEDALNNTVVAGPKSTAILTAFAESL